MQQIAAQLAHDVLRNRQPEANAFGLGCHEGLEQRIAQGGRHARAVIGD